jgi:hypothetical protein
MWKLYDDRSLQPNGDNSTRRNNPLFGHFNAWRLDATAADLGEEPSGAVEEDVGDDTNNDAICDAKDCGE